jgi:AbrB family looped-hinge helix DNA binding protein
MRHTVRGRITIPKTLRDKYGMTESTELEFTEKQEGLRPAPG